MAYAIVQAGTAPLCAGPAAGGQVDEVLHGMAVEVTGGEENGCCPVRTAWGMAGWLEKSALHSDAVAAKEWMAYGKQVARAPFVDVMERPAVDSARLVCLPRGALVHPLQGQDDDGWLPVGLPGGGRGYVKAGNLMLHITGLAAGGEEKPLREALATSALSYLGTQYRWGGRTPAGIDSVGLVSMAYLLNGAVVPRHQHSIQFVPGGHLAEIPREALGMGDVIFFKGHVALYLGEGQYVHATGRFASDAVVINSLQPDSAFYREDLAGSVVACASLFAR